jgi:hypothetical protein
MVPKASWLTTLLPAMRFPPESAALQNRLRTVQDHDRAYLLNSGEVRNPPNPAFSP